MIRLGTAFWLALVAILGFAMFKVKYEVMQIEEELARTNRAIAADEDSLHVLKAEWSFLSQPGRLAELSRRYLDLTPLATAQLGRVDAIPLRPAANPLALAEAPAITAPAMTAPAGIPAHAPPPPVAPKATAGSTTRLATAKLRSVQ